MLDGTGRDGIGDRLRYYCDNDGPYMHSVRGGMSSINGSALGHLPSRALNSFTRQASVDPIRTWSSFDGWHVWVAGIGWTRQSSIINATVMTVMVHLAPLQSAALWISHQKRTAVVTTLAYFCCVSIITFCSAARL